MNQCFNIQKKTKQNWGLLARGDGERALSNLNPYLCMQKIYESEYFYSVFFTIIILTSLNRINSLESVAVFPHQALKHSSQLRWPHGKDSQLSDRSIFYNFLDLLLNKVICHHQWRKKGCLSVQSAFSTHQQHLHKYHLMRIL